MNSGLPVAAMTSFMSFTLMLSSGAEAADLTLCQPSAAPIQMPSGADSIAWMGAVDVVPAMAYDVGVDDTVTFFVDDRTELAGLVTRQQIDGRGQVTLAGVLSDGGDFVLIAESDFMAASLRPANGDTMRLRPGHNGQHIIERINESALEPCDTPDAAVPGMVTVPPTDGGIAGGCPNDDGSVIDVMIFYTPASALGAGGNAAMESIIQLAVADANQAYIASEVETQLNLIYMSIIDYDENASHLGALGNGNDGIMDEAHDLRDALGADLVTLYVNSAGYCGVAWLPPYEGSQEYGFSVVVWSCSSLVYAHEIGHNQGCCHAPGDGGGCTSGGFWPFSVGHRFFGDSGTQWRTIMAYSPGNRIGRFSNPDILFDGMPTGIPGNGFDAADNVRTINQLANALSNYRCHGGACDEDDLADLNDCNGNMVPDMCDIAAGLSEDINGNFIPDDCEAVSNDSCVSASLLFAGSHDITNEIATTDGSGECTSFQRDVWYRFVASCEGTATITLCDATFADSLAVYASCPNGPDEAIACVTDPCGTTTEVTGPGLFYIRVGSTNGSMGTATLTLTCTPDNTCHGDFTGNDTVDISDLLLLLAAWGTDDALYDIAPEGGDGIVDVQDLLDVLAAWGDC